MLARSRIVESDVEVEKSAKLTDSKLANLTAESGYKLRSSFEIKQFFDR